MAEQASAEARWCIPMKITIPNGVTEISVFLDDIRKEPQGFIRTYTVNETIELIQYCQTHHIQINTLSLDNDLGEFERDGYKVMDWIDEESILNKDFVLPKKILVHSSNPTAKRRMEQVISRLYLK